MIKIPTGAETYFNIALLIFYLIFMIGSYRKGFLRSVVSLAGGLLSLFLAFRYCTVASQYFHLWPSSWTPFQDTLIQSKVYEYFNETAWFVVIFVVLKLVFYLLEKLMAGIQSIPVLKQISGVLGAILGFCSATIWVLVVCVVLNTPLFEGGSDIISNSYLGIVQTETSAVLSEIGITSNSDIINQIYTAAQNLDDQDKSTVEQWLEGQGYHKIDSTDSGFSSKSSAEPSASADPSASAESSASSN